MKLSRIVSLCLCWLPALALAADPHAGHAGHGDPSPPLQQVSEPRILYWYDPMYPQQHFDGPGRSPFMDMDLVPRYADPGDDGSSMRIDPSITRNLGLRVASVESGRLALAFQASAVLGWDQRHQTLLQNRARAWVERVEPLASEDLLQSGQLLATLMVPEWVTAQEEYLALRRLGDTELQAAAWQRLRLSGMPEELLNAVRREGRVQMHWQIRSPQAGVLLEWPLRAGMSLSADATLARIGSIEKVWLEVAVPEQQAHWLEAGQLLQVQLPGLAPQQARIEALLPQADSQARTVRVRAVLENPQGLLRPGMSAQVSLQRQAEQPQLLIPADALIRGGRRDLVLLAEADGRFRPQQVLVGREAGDRVEILEGLQAGQRVVSAAQFLIDSEASLRGLLARAAEDGDPDLHSADAMVIYHDEDGLMLEHGPFESLGMDGMTMQFEVAPGVDLSDIAEGDAVRVWVRQLPDGLPVVRIRQREVQP